MNSFVSSGLVLHVLAAEGLRWGWRWDFYRGLGQNHLRFGKKAWWRIGREIEWGKVLEIDEMKMGWEETFRECVRVGAGGGGRETLVRGWVFRFLFWNFNFPFAHLLTPPYLPSPLHVFLSFSAISYGDTVCVA